MNAALGEGGTTLLIAPSPVSRAQRLADDFLNLRFATALLIALIVYYWRYHSKTAIFGARSIDYDEPSGSASPQTRQSRRCLR